MCSAFKFSHFCNRPARIKEVLTFFNIPLFLEGETELLTYFIMLHVFIIITNQIFTFLHPPPPLSKLSLFPSSCVSLVELTDGRGGKGVGEESNHTNAIEPGLARVEIASYRPVIKQNSS
jgi:hypothetical protein